MPNARINPDTFYVNGTPIPASYFQAIDTAQFQAINGNDGGTWTPSSPLVIGGAGAWACSATWQLNVSPAIKTPLGSGVRITHGDSDWIWLGSGHAGASRNLRTSLALAADTSFSAGAASGLPTVTAHVVSHGAQTTTSAGASYAGGARLAMPIRVHNGATLTEVDFYLIVGSSHLPATFPAIRVVRVDTAGNAVPLCNTPSTTGFLGAGWLAFLWPNPPNAPSYYAAGVVQTSPYPVDASLQLVDTSRYAYVAQVIDEGGAGAAGGNIYFEVLAKFSSIPDLRPQ